MLTGTVPLWREIPDDGTLLMRNLSEFFERRGINAVLLHLDVQRLEVGSEESRRLAFVSFGALKNAPDRLLLGVRGGRLGDLLQRSAEWRGLARKCCRF